jgi:glucose-1-phosphate cytidylyltransferase
VELVFSLGEMTKVKGLRMKVVILAGGKGSRLGERTSLVPKPMLPIGNKPILWHIMKIYSHHGFNDFIICIGYLGEKIKNYFYNFDILNSDFTINLKNKDITFHKLDNEADWRVTLVDTGLNTLKGGRIKRIAKYLDSEINMLTYGDGLADINVTELINFHKQQGKCLTLTGVYPPSRFGEILQKNNKYVFFSEKPQTSASLINGGFIVFTKKMLDYLTEDEECDFEHGPLMRMADDHEIAIYKHKGNWECMDTERDYLYLNNLWHKNQAFWKLWK